MRKIVWAGQWPSSQNSAYRDGHNLCRACYTVVCRSRPGRTSIPDAVSCSGSWVSQLQGLLLRGGLVWRFSFRPLSFCILQPLLNGSFFSEVVLRASTWLFPLPWHGGHCWRSRQLKTNSFPIKKRATTYFVSRSFGSLVAVTVVIYGQPYIWSAISQCRQAMSIRFCMSWWFLVLPVRKDHWYSMDFLVDVGFVGFFLNSTQLFLFHFVFLPEFWA